MSETIEVEAIVKRFIPNAMHDEFESGIFTSYDATELEVVAPASWQGRGLTIYHSESPELVSPWRGINQKLRFSIKEDDLKHEGTLFDGAVSLIEASR